MKILHIFISKEHNYFGHHNLPPGTSEIIEVTEASLVEGKGIEGDRFFDYKEGYKGQVTFFEFEAFLDLQDRFGVFDRGPEAFRRNIIVTGVDLNSLIGKEFEIQGIRFQGMEEAKPCSWMETAFCKGAERSLAGRGGLRARVLSSGVLRSNT